MDLTNQIAEIIWKIREELFLDGSPDHDKQLARDYIKDKGGKVDYIKIYMWLMELDEFIIKFDKDEE